VRDQAKWLASVASGGVGLVDCHFRGVQHPIPEGLVRMIVKRSQESNTNIGQVFQVGIRDLARRTVVLDEVLIVLVVRGGEFRERAQVFDWGVDPKDSFRTNMAWWSGTKPRTRAPQRLWQRMRGALRFSCLFLGRWRPEHGDRFDFDQ
jgi:hypothetical protein